MTEALGLMAVPLIFLATLAAALWVATRGDAPIELEEITLDEAERQAEEEQCS